MASKFMNGNIIFENLDPNNIEQASAYVEWTKDQLMVENWTRQIPNKPLVDYTLDQFKADFSTKKDLEKYSFMVKVNNKYVGYGQIIINHPVAMVKDKKVAWPSIAVGNSLFRTKGLGLLICRKIYDLAKQHNCEVIEAGIFEFNTPMKRILLKNGFQLIGFKENITFMHSQWYRAEHYLLVV